jgi:Tol biopolymer transport system component
VSGYRGRVTRLNARDRAAFSHAAAANSARFLRGSELVVFVNELAIPEEAGIYSVDPDGSGLSRLVEDTTAAALSPDGSLIAFVRFLPTDDPDDQYAPHLFVMNADGSGQRPLIVESDLTAIVSVAWSPDGSRIALTASAGPGDYQVYLVNSDGSGLRRITDHWATLPAWSPDSQWIAFNALEEDAHQNIIGGGIDVARADGTDRRPVIRAAPDWAQYPLWFPDGERLLYSLTPADFQDDPNWTQHLYEIRLDGTGARQFTDGPFGDIANAFSPDGTQLLLARVPAPRGAAWPKLYLANSDGTGIREFVAVPGSGASWSAVAANHPPPPPRPAVPPIGSRYQDADRPPVPPLNRNRG